MEILSYENIIITKTMNNDLEYKFCDFANYDVFIRRSNLISRNGPKYVSKWPRYEPVVTVMQVIQGCAII